MNVGPISVLPVFFVFFYSYDTHFKSADLVCYVLYKTALLL
jgi:hypothetical protein